MKKYAHKLVDKYASKERKLGPIVFYSTFQEQVNHRHPVFILSGKINCLTLEETFAKHYREGFGRPASSIRLMVSLLMIKHLSNLSDESVVNQWAENAYYQYFSEQKTFASKESCEASELVHFRNRIGVEGVELTLKESIRINDKESHEDKAA